MAALHAAAFSQERGWSAQEFETLLASPYVTAFADHDGFALTRTLAGESELLTLAVSPAHRRRGIARGLLVDWLHTLGRETETAFLEVAADNTGALALYAALGFQRTGQRRGYYARQTGPAVDAVLMTKALTRG